jgi:hypothetical protein
MFPNALSLVRLWAEQKLVPLLPILQLSRMLKGVTAKDGAAANTTEAAAAIAMAVLMRPSNPNIATETAGLSG